MSIRARDLVRPALEAFLADRLRVTLSAIGVVVGIATVVAAIAVGEGARREAVAEIGALGVDNLFVRSIQQPDPGIGRRLLAPALTIADARVLAATIPDVQAVAILRSAATVVDAGATQLPAVLVGVSPSWRSVAGATTSRGRWLTDPDADDRRRVAVIGTEMAARLFGSDDPIGRDIRAGGNWYVVVGLLSDRATSRAPASIQGFDASRALYVPVGAMDLTLGTEDSLDRVEQIAIRTSGAGAVERAVSAVGAALTKRQLPPGSFEVVVPRELLAARLRAQRTFNVVLLAIGALALVISGVGIMNVMLASVAERTQEIGIRRAFGASRRDVVTQFAVESAALCLAGGLAGVPAGALLSALIAFAAGWPVAVSAWSVGLALALAGSVGLGFGIFPALRAARIEPVEALRAI